MIEVTHYTLTEVTEILDEHGRWLHRLNMLISILTVSVILLTLALVLR